jgi:hypothetical protein
MHTLQGVLTVVDGGVGGGFGAVVCGLVVGIGDVVLKLFGLLAEIPSGIVCGACRFERIGDKRLAL